SSIENRCCEPRARSPERWMRDRLSEAQPAARLADRPSAQRAQPVELTRASDNRHIASTPRRGARHDLPLSRAEAPVQLIILLELSRCGTDTFRAVRRGTGWRTFSVCTAPPRRTRTAPAFQPAFKSTVDDEGEGPRPGVRTAKLARYGSRVMHSQ